MAEGASPRFADGFSTSPDPAAVVDQVADQIAQRAREPSAPPAAIMVFTAGVHAAATAGVTEAIASRLGAIDAVGVSTRGVVGRWVHAERTAGVSVLAVWAEAGGVETFNEDGLEAVFSELNQPAAMTLVFADPFSLAVSTGLARLTVPGVVIGGIASGGTRPGENTLIAGGRVRHDGVVGVRFAASRAARVLVSHNCRPIGPRYVVTAAKGSFARSIGGRSAVLAAREAVTDLSSHDRDLLPAGLFLGCAPDGAKPRLGRGDFVMRRVVGVEETTGGLALNGPVRTGQTVQFHVRDAQSGREDLQLLLDGEALHGPPAGVLMIAGRRRDEREPSAAYDEARVVQGAFGLAVDGAAAAKAGREVASVSTGGVPLAGFSTEGEIATSGGTAALHEQTVCLAVFRSGGAGDSPEGGDHEVGK